MVMGGCLRVSWICLLFCYGNCFPIDYDNKNTSLASESLTIPNQEFTASSPGNETASRIEGPDETSDSNSTSTLDLLSPRAFYVGPLLHKGEMSSGFTGQPPLVSSPGGSYPSANTWSAPFHESMYTSSNSYPYTYGHDSRGYPYDSYVGIHAESPPYGFNYGSAGSPHYAYGPVGYPTSGYAYGMRGSPQQAYDRRIHASPYGVGAPPAYTYLPWQSSILDPELFLIGNILMKFRKMPLGQAWLTSEVPMDRRETPIVYPSSHATQSNKAYNRARDLLSDIQYVVEEPLEPDAKTLQTQQDVPEADF